MAVNCAEPTLELFKKTLPAPSAVSLGQVEVSEGDMRSRALATLQKAMRPSGNSRLGFLVLALRGKKVGMEKVVGMIDAMVVTLKKDQQDAAGSNEGAMHIFSLSSSRGILAQILELEQTWCQQSTPHPLGAKLQGQLRKAAPDG